MNSIIIDFDTSAIAGPSKVNHQMIISEDDSISDDDSESEYDAKGKRPMQRNRKRRKKE